MSYLALVVSQPAEQFVKFLQQQTIGACMTVNQDAAKLKNLP